MKSTAAPSSASPLSAAHPGPWRTTAARWRHDRRQQAPALRRPATARVSTSSASWSSTECSTTTTARCSPPT
ncbi:hypothetical protein [Nocardioides convexus]|uniref:hypothetical protein n=1 Tax=Nocardioides convexus TaxID=2712224 RepID=UPI00241863DA|nr:hypothetical protein [Nocardioides convexus]